MKGGADASSVTSSLLDVEKPLWLKRLWVGTEMIGAGSWLLPACLEKLQEISGADVFFVTTQTAAKQNIIRRVELKIRFMTTVAFAIHQFFSPSWAGGEKNSTSVARLVKKSFRKNSASFKQKQTCYSHWGRWVCQVFNAKAKSIWINSCTWSILRRRGIRETRRQHSWGAWPDSGHMCSALTVNYEQKQTGR